MDLNLSDWLGQHVFATGEYEPATSALLKSCLHRGDVFVDVGANVGYFSLLAASIVEPEGYVLSLEPVPETLKRLEYNIRLNGFARCEVFGVAASNSDGTCGVFVGPTNHIGVSSFRELEQSTDKIQVATAMLDTLCSNRQRIDVVKIDVEGAECHVLEGMKSILDQCQPDLVVEVTYEFLAALGRSVKDIEEILVPRNYRMFAIEHVGLRPLTSLQDYPAEQFNAFFTARATLPSAVRVLS